MLGALYYVALSVLEWIALIANYDKGLEKSNREKYQAENLLRKRYKNEK